MFVKNKETAGTLFALIGAVIVAFGPIVANFGTKNIPPLMFGGISCLVASLFFFFICLSQKTLGELKSKKSYFSIMMVIIFIIIIPYVLFFIGTSKTSGLNSSLLQTCELVFTLIFTHYIGEKNTLIKYVGAGGILLGSSFLMFNGSFKINLGDILIIIATASYPIGNFYSKKVLNNISPSALAFSRYLFGGLFVLVISLLTENYTNFFSILVSNWFYFIFYGLITAGLSTVFYYQALKRLDISKAVSLGMTYPLYGLLFLIILGQKISLYQGIGIIIILFGLYFSIMRQSVNPKLTKYAEVNL